MPISYIQYSHFTPCILNNVCKYFLITFFYMWCPKTSILRIWSYLFWSPKTSYYHLPPIFSFQKNTLYFNRKKVHRAYTEHHTPIDKNIDNSPKMMSLPTSIFLRAAAAGSKFGR